MEKPIKSKKKRKKIIRIIVWSVAVLAVILVGGFFLSKTLQDNKSSENMLTKTTALVQRGDVSRTLGVSSSLNSSETDDYNAEISGEVLKINYSEGDLVDANQVVMIIDTEVTDDTIESLENQITAKNDQIEILKDTLDDTYSSIDNQNDNITDFKNDITELQDEVRELDDDIIENEEQRENLQIFAPLAGTVFNIQVSEGDYVNTSTLLATITNPLKYEVEMPFSVDFLNYEIDEIIIHFKNSDLTGEIVSYADYTYTDTYGKELVDVVISFERFAALPEDARVKGTIKTDPITYKCITEISPYYAETENIFPELQGELLELNLIEKQSVAAGDLIAIIDGESLDNNFNLLTEQISLKNDQIISLNDSIEDSIVNIEQLNENIIDYNEDINDLLDEIDEIETEITEAEEGYISSEVTAEFAGIITGLTVEEGDDIVANQKLFTLVSMDNPSMSLTIDELDITDVTIGLLAEVVIDALVDTETNPVPAVVTDIALAGNTQGGVTTYSVTVTLSETPDGFKLGMNATATVFTSQSANTLFIPIEAVSIAGDKSFVWVTETSIDKSSVIDKSAFAENAKTAGAASGKGSGKRPGAAVEKDTSQMTEEQKARYEEYLKNSEKDIDASSDSNLENSFPSLEEYYANATMVPITTGIHNETYIEVLSGLTEGQIVVLPPVYMSEASTDKDIATGMNLGTARKAMGGIGGGK